MSEKRKAEADTIHGLSIVDTTINDIHEDEGKGCRPEDDTLVVKIEDEADAIIVHDDEHLADDEEAEEKINLFDVMEEKKPQKENRDTFQNSTLIITTEEHLDTTTCDDTLNSSAETIKNVPTLNESINSEEPKKILTPRIKGADHNYFWVANISRRVKATDLKKFFSQLGKVVTAKILTNGKNYFGYVSVDSAETAGKCIKQMNNTLFDGKNIVVSKDRPDLKEAKQSIKLESRRRKSEKLDLKKENKTAESKVEEEKHEARKTKVSEDAEVKTNNVIAELNKKLDKFKAELSKYKWKVTEYQRRHDGMRKKCDNLEKELKETQYKMRADRRKLNQDREQFEKTKKMDQIRLEADKAHISKELAEVKKLREHLKAKIDEIKAHPKKNSKRRGSRSPPPVERSRSPRGRSPLLRVNSRINYRPEERMEKKRKHDDPSRGRTPPPPPKLSNGMGKKRGENLPHRQYFENVEKRSSPLQHGHGFEYRHKPSFAAPQEMPRAPWQNNYSKDPRRMNTTPSAGQNYPPDPRYSGGYQFPPSSISAPTRSYYPEFSKPYGHY